MHLTLLCLLCEVHQIWKEDRTEMWIRIGMLQKYDFKWSFVAMHKFPPVFSTVFRLASDVLIERTVHPTAYDVFSYTHNIMVDGRIQSNLR